ncbi:MAG TPA: hypothetical protein VED85_04965, partial [Burkholderiaceae bacterium]|nr:hypothetical protein [Burkholderiaceae bacterium]
PMFAISAATGEGCRDLMWAVQRFLEQRGVPGARLSLPAADATSSPRQSLPVAEPAERVLT